LAELFESEDYDDKSAFEEDGSGLLKSFLRPISSVLLEAVCVCSHIRRYGTRTWPAGLLILIERFGGRYLTEPGSHEVLEGDRKPNRVVTIEFPGTASIRARYGAPEYQPL